MTGTSPQSRSANASAKGLPGKWMVEDCSCIDSKPIVAGRHAPSTARWAGRTRGKPPPMDTAPGIISVGSARQQPPARPKPQFSSEPLHTNPPPQTCQRRVGAFSFFGSLFFRFREGQKRKKRTFRYRCRRCLSAKIAWSRHSSRGKRLALRSTFAIFASFRSARTSKPWPRPLAKTRTHGQI